MALSYYRLIWLLPIAFILHVGEEYIWGFPAWAEQVTGYPMDLLTFLGSNIAFIVVMALMTRGAARARRAAASFWLLAWAAGNLFWNFVFHLLCLLMLGLSSPGLVTATLIYLPLSLLIWWVALRQKIVGPAALVGAIALGALFMASVAAIGIFHVGGVGA